MVVVNPFREPALERYWIPSDARSAVFGSSLMDDFVPVRPAGDIAFMSGLLKALDEAGAWDEGYLARHTTGSAELRAHLAELDWSELEQESGIAESEIRRIAGLYAQAQRAVFIYSMGLTQYSFGVENVEMVVNLALARGMIGREGTGILPIRGHSGVQGSAECGADADKLPGALPINDETCAALEHAWGHPVPRRSGLRAAHLLDAAGERGLDLLYLVGGNHLATMPDRAHAERALTQVGLRVHQDIVLNTSTLLDAREAVLVLPAQTRYEQRSGGTSTSTERRIRFTPEIPGPRIAEALPEWEIPSLIGQRLRPEQSALFDYPDTSAIRQEMARVMPLYAGIETLKEEGDWVQWGGPRLGSDGFPNLPEGKARFTVVSLPRLVVPPGHYLLTLRRGKQFNSITYGDSDPLTRGAQRHAVLIDERDMARAGLDEGAQVLVHSAHGQMEGTVRSAPCRPGSVQVFWPEGNVLLDRRYDPRSGEPDYATTVRVERLP